MSTTKMAANSEEKDFLGPVFRSHRRYGSVAVNMKKPEFSLKHRVSKLDTLQGIALKYGVTIECIKQVNKLWSKESMFLHEFLDIPVSKSAYESVMGSSGPSEDSLTCRSQSSDSDRSSDNNSYHSSQSSTPRFSRSPSLPGGMTDCSEKSASDFLSKIDSNIAVMKSNIQRMESLSSPLVEPLKPMELDDSNHTTSQRSDTSYQNRIRSGIYLNGYRNPTSPPHPIVTQGRVITMSLKRLLREHEELYEL